MNSLPVSEYDRNYSWHYSDRYSRRSPSNIIGSSHRNLQYLLKPPHYAYEPSRLDHRVVAKQFLKLNPALNITGAQDEKKTGYDLSQSTYKDTFRKHAKYPSIGDYVRIAEKVADSCLPEYIKYHYEPEKRCEKIDLGSGSPNVLKSVDVKVREPTCKEKKKKEVSKKMLMKSMDKRLPPKITDLGACHYRNDILPECMPRYKQSLDDYINEVYRNSWKDFRKYGYGGDEPDVQKEKPKRYTNLFLY